MGKMKKEFRPTIFGMGGWVLLAFFLAVAGCVSDSDQVKTSLQQPVKTSEAKLSAVDPSNGFWKHPVPSGAQDG